MIRKEQFHITVDPELKERIKQRGINASRLFNSCLEEALNELDSYENEGELLELSEHQITEFTLPEFEELSTSDLIGNEDE